MSLRLVELGFALLNAGAQHWRNMTLAPHRLNGVRLSSASDGGAEAASPRRATLFPKPNTLVEVRESRGGKGAYLKGPGEKQRQPHTTQLRTSVGLKVVFNEVNHGEAPFYSVEQEGKTLIIT